MSKGLIFSCCAYAILLFTIVNLSVGPIISGKVGTDDDIYWGTMNCEYYNDRYDEDKKTLLRKECMIWNTHPSFLILLLDLSVAY